MLRSQPRIKKCKNSLLLDLPTIKHLSKSKKKKLPFVIMDPPKIQTQLLSQLMEATLLILTTPPQNSYIPNKEEEYDKDKLEAEPKQETAEEELGNFKIPDFSYAHQFFNYRAPAKKLAIPYLCLLPC